MDRRTLIISEVRERKLTKVHHSNHTSMHQYEVLAGRASTDTVWFDKVRPFLCCETCDASILENQVEKNRDKLFVRREL